MSELFSTQIGLLSLFTILFVVVMAGFFVKFYSDRIAEDEKKAAQQRRSAKAS
ncbi:MAG: DUF3149 domain-containing protein [Azoarcus sp.]|jgi:hypothetical protein|nr:DUF3149 domain-containing protein [Azoarcus sp.]